MLNSREYSLHMRPVGGHRNLFLWGIFSVLLLVLLCTSQVFAFNIPKPTKNFYVNDTAEILSEEFEDYVIQTNAELCEKTGAQVVIVTIDSLDGAPLEEYATELFREYGIGNAEENNGILMLLALTDRKSRIEVGYGLEGAINDGKSGRIQDNYMIPYFKEYKWDEGLKNGFDAIIGEIAAEYDVEITCDEPVRVTPSNDKDKDDEEAWDKANTTCCIAFFVSAGVGAILGLFPTGLFILIPALGWLILLFNYISAHCGAGWAIITVFGSALFMLAGYGIVASNLDDSDDGYGGGGYSSHSSSSSHSSGGYSSHSSSSSHSSGGYSGGGGRSGGGGSSRSW